MRHTLHPTPYALRPAPYTLQPTPCTLHPKSSTENLILLLEGRDLVSILGALPLLPPPHIVVLHLLLYQRVQRPAYRLERLIGV